MEPIRGHRPILTPVVKVCPHLGGTLQTQNPRPKIGRGQSIRKKPAVIAELLRSPGRRSARGLTKKEYDLPEYLVRNKNLVLARERILQEIWGYKYMGDTNVVDVYLRYLRSKLDEPFEQKYIHTVRGVGYVVKN